jgi:hypothetical protein
MDWAKVAELLKQLNEEFKEDNDKAENKMKVIVNQKEVDVGTIEISKIDPSDYPDYADAYVESAEFVDGSKLSESELDYLQDNYSDLVYEIIYDNVCCSADAVYPD